VDHGLIVSDVEPESTAAKAGILRGDIILEINREKVEKVAQYIKALQAAQEKKSILLLIQRDQNTRFVVIETEK
jgi:S1-C subfamily serine protease